MELNEMMDKELKRRFEDLENLKTGSDEQSKATDLGADRPMADRQNLPARRVCGVFP